MTAAALRRFTGFLTASLLLHGAVLAWLRPPRGALSGSGAAPVDITLASTPSGAGAPRPAAHRAAKEPMRQPPDHARPVVPNRGRTPAMHQIARRRQPAQNASGAVSPHSRADTFLSGRAHMRPQKTATAKLRAVSSPTPGSGSHRLARPAAGGSHATGHGTLTLRLQRVLRAKLTRYFRYPPLARRRGWQGRVVVSLSINGRGQLSHLKIAHSSGYPILDRAALHSLQQVGRLPGAGAWLGGRDVKVKLPVRYQLVNS